MAKPLNNEKQYRKNDFLFKAGDPADKLYVLVQGLVSICVPGPEKNLELYKVAQPQIIGEELLRGEAVYSTSAVALNDAVVLEIPLAAAQDLINGATPIVKSLLVGMLAKHAQIATELKTARIESGQALPCPLAKVAKLFAVIYRTASYTGKKKDGVISVEWNGFRKYCQRVFLESPVRIEQAMWLLASLKFAEMQMVPDETDPEGPELLGYIHFRNLEPLGAFSEFYRKNFNPNDPQAIRNTAGAQSKTVSGILAAIDFWNKNGQPKGMPLPPEPTNKYAPAKKVS